MVQQRGFGKKIINFGRKKNIATEVNKIITNGCYATFYDSFLDK